MFIIRVPLWAMMASQTVYLSTVVFSKDFLLLLTLDRNGECINASVLYGHLPLDFLRPMSLATANIITRAGATLVRVTLTAACATSCTVVIFLMID